MRPAASSTAPLVLAAFVIGAICALVWIPPDATTAGPPPEGALAATTPMANGCRADAVVAGGPGQVDPCATSQVSVSARPSCPVCPGGVRVVFIEREVATEARWMVDEATGVLDELVRLYAGEEIRAAVIHYRKGGIRTVVEMTDRLQTVRSGLARPRAAADPPYANDSAAAAAREALSQMQPAEGEDPSLPRCRLVVLFAEAGRASC